MNKIRSDLTTCTFGCLVLFFIEISNLYNSWLLPALLFSQDYQVNADCSPPIISLQSPVSVQDDVFNPSSLGSTDAFKKKTERKNEIKTSISELKGKVQSHLGSTSRLTGRLSVYVTQSFLR